MLFCERAKQLLKDNAIAAIILPSSLLNKGGIYESTREIILQNFYIIAIVELGSQTFGATGTNTIILFLQKHKSLITNEQTRISQDYAMIKDRLDSQNLIANDDFEIKDFIKSYCELRGFKEDEFLSLLDSKLESSLLENTNFKDYKSAFIKTNEYKKLIESKNYKDSAYKKDLEDKAFINYARNIEKQKLLYFALCLNHQVLIIKSPQDNKEQKKFLGYEWSNRKGDEGLKELNSPYITPLFERENLNNPNKLSFLIKQSFLKNECEIPNELEKYASKAKLVDMIDFSKIEFDKAISLNPTNKAFFNPFANCKYELVRLSEVVLTIQTAKRPDGGVGNYDSGALSLGGEHIDNKNGYVKLDSLKYVPMEFYEKFKFEDKGIVKENDILICKDGALTGKIALVRNEFKNKSVMINEHIFLLRCDNVIKQKYLFFILHSNEGQELLKSKITGSAQGGLNQSNLKNIQIPLPPLEVQEKIISAIETIESKISALESRNAILANAKNEILNKYLF